MIHTLLSSFPIVEQFVGYTAEELATIVVRFARLMNFEIDATAADRIVRSAGGTPLGVLHRFRRVRDYAQVKHDGCITVAVADEAVANAGFSGAST